MVRIVIAFVFALLLSVSSVIGSATAKNWNTGTGKQKTSQSLEKFTTDKAILGDTTLIKIIQKQLNELGFYKGNINGAFDNRTKGAVIEFSQMFNEKPYNVLNQALVDRIALVHAGRFDSPFNQKGLIKPTAYLPATSVFTTDIRKDLNNCDDCRVTTFLLASGDMDGDGTEEIVLGTHRHNPKWAVINKPSPLKIISFKNGKGEPLKTIVGNALPSRVHEREGIIRDFNNDGLGDLFVAAHGHDAQPFVGEQNILILSGPNEHFDASDTHLPKLSDMAHGVDAADIDADGDLDLFIITNENQQNILPYVLLNDGKGKFSRKKISVFLDKSIVDFNTSPRKHRAQYSTVRFADLNNDGHPDLILLARGEAPEDIKKFRETRRSLVIFNDGFGKFPNSNIVELPTDRWGYGTFTNDAEAIDLNSDGLKDLILTQSTRLANNGAWRGHYLQVLINRGDRFVDRTAERLWRQGYASNPNEFQFADKTTMADVDNDGDVDIVTRSLGPSFKQNFKSAVVQIGINDGMGGFLAADPKWFTNGKEHHGVAPITGDFDGDGVADIASYRLNYISFNDQTVGVRLSIHKVAQN